MRVPQQAKAAERPFSLIRHLMSCRSRCHDRAGLLRLLEAASTADLWRADFFGISRPVTPCAVTRPVADVTALQGLLSGGRGVV
jgi:hypothetical protein